MKTAYTGEPGRDWQLEKGPFTFIGKPGECIGELTFSNPTDDKIKIRRLSVESVTDKKRKAPTLDSAELSMQLRIPPQSTITAQALLNFSPSTPPGNYEVRLVCGDRSETVHVQILENPSLALNPTHTVLRGASGDTLSCKVRMENAGNVPLSVGDVGMVWFRERNWIGRTLVYSLREAAEDEDYEAFANRILHDFKASIIPPVSIQMEPLPDETLHPATALDRTLTFTAPPGLQKGRTYSGFVKINMTRIWLELYCNGSPNSSKRR
ncbi:hypothetical protein BTA51_27345 [Hahella sp. CCB-MM4]|uniref:hypothetical protein n=1 Tax=Hahella sp. (strain CCB-MM4) TaxID=1926491 RepID=UPI000B9A1F9C|nr:hypothetical protein [Hahella sp. CCB-MM4]OZG70190.1 hypothetical protein BTA51_27345 [Hahella sp. CCB-MM4]